jgi:hypothetical protein
LLQVLEHRIAPALERIAAELARLETSLPTGSAPARGRLADELRQALASEIWHDVVRLEERLRQEEPEHPELEALQRAVAEGRGRAGAQARAKLEAARAAIDPDAVLEYHLALGPLLEAEAMRSLEQDVLRWLIGLIQRRMRTGTVQADVVHLAERVAERFAAWPEGASLRASLPTLRRSAGLCAACGEPYAGLAAACPKCLARPHPSTPAAAP